MGDRIGTLTGHACLATRRPPASRTHARRGEGRVAGRRAPGRFVPETLATAALAYWLAFFDPLEGKPGEERAFSQKGKDALLVTVRALSWVETMHGTTEVGGSAPFNPIQSANPLDAWWRSLTRKGKHDFFQLREPSPQGKPKRRAEGVWANELINYVNADQDAPATVKLAQLGKELRRGHSAKKFNPLMSYFWAVPHLIHRMNRQPPGHTYHFGDWDHAPFVMPAPHPLRMIEGAVSYNGLSRKHPNGVGDSSYRAKFMKALALIAKSSR